MEKRNIVLAGMILCCFFAGLTGGQETVKPWEKYGISQTEWKMVQDNKIALDKLEIILSSGIGIAEYCQKPWVKLKIKESDWIDKRRAGMSSYDIELDVQSDRTGYKQDNRMAIKSETESATTKQSAGLLTSFLLPGVKQQKIGQKTRGKIMSGIALGCIAGCFVGSVAQAKFEPIPLFFLIPDMFWSLFDYKVSVKKKEQE
jgi:hypothetical protein